MFDFKALLDALFGWVAMLLDLLLGGSVLGLVVVGACLMSGCRSTDQTAAVMQTLQQGKAEGHLVLTTPGAVSVGERTEFFIGAMGTSLSFDGEIDFSDAQFKLPTSPNNGENTTEPQPETAIGDNPDVVP